MRRSVLNCEDATWEKLRFILVQVHKNFETSHFEAM